MNKDKPSRERINSIGQLDEYSKRKRTVQEELKGEEQEIFQKSKKIIRSPTKGKEVNLEKPEEMEALQKLIESISKDIKEIKAENREIKQDLRDNNKKLEEKLDQQSEEIKLLRKELEVTKQEWQKDKEQTERKIEELEKKVEESVQKLEAQDKEKRKNNLIITGLKIDIEDRNALKEAVKNFITQNLKIEPKIKTVYKIGDARCVIELENWTDKMEVLKNKAKLHLIKDQKVYLDSDLTVSERKIQASIREKAKELKQKGENVKIGYQKLIINGKQVSWDKKQGCLQEKPKN